MLCCWILEVDSVKLYRLKKKGGRSKNWKFIPTGVTCFSPGFLTYQTGGGIPTETPKMASTISGGSAAEELKGGFFFGVSKNSGFPPKSSILIGFSIISHPFWGTPILGNTHLRSLFLQGLYIFKLPQFGGDQTWCKILWWVWRGGGDHP